MAYVALAIGAEGTAIAQDGLVMGSAFTPVRAIATRERAGIKTE
jgi:hypothetical protein